MESYQEKLEWARKQLDALDRDMRAFVNADAYEVIRHFDAKTRKGFFRFVIKKPIPLEWSLRVGDIVHNMRSGLDALVYALALKHSGKPTDKQAIDIQFLICDTEAEFAARAARRHGRMSHAAQDGIAFVQPHKRPRAGFKNELSVLRDLSNIDKHRHILPGYVSSRGRITVGHPDAKVALRLGFRGRLEDGTILGSFELPIGADELDVTYEPKLAIEIAFAERSAGNTSMVGVLRLIDTYIREVVLAEMEQYLV